MIFCRTCYTDKRIIIQTNGFKTERGLSLDLEETMQAIRVSGDDMLQIIDPRGKGTAVPVMIRRPQTVPTSYMR